MLKRAKAFSPSGLTSFFEICDKTSDGQIITDPMRVGARGGGFSPAKGVTTEVLVEDADKNQVKVFINGNFCPDATTTKCVVEDLLSRVSDQHTVTVKHEVDIPIGAGFGSSAAGALGVVLALSKALRINLTYTQLGDIAHVAEVKSKSGLGTVGPLMFGGCGLTIEPGAPSVARLDQVPISSDLIMIVGTFRPYPTKEMLSFTGKRESINFWGKKTLQRILDDCSLENFMIACKTFAFETGFATERVKKLIDSAEDAGAIGAAQNMLGEAVHALVTVENVDCVHEVFKKFLPEQNILIANIDFQGARILG